MPHWHEHNPWKDQVVYVPIEALALCQDAAAPEMVLNHWRHAGFKLDAYILPQPSGYHSIGIRYGARDSDYLSPYSRNPDQVASLLARTLLQKLQHSDDTETAHSEADDILCDLLKTLGHTAVVDEWKRVPKWYA